MKTYEVTIDWRLNGTEILEIEAATEIEATELARTMVVDGEYNTDRADLIEIRGSLVREVPGV